TRVTKEILDLVTELAHDGPTDTELARAKKRHGWHMRSMLDGTEELADLVALTALSGRVESPLERARAIEAVSRDQVIETARTLGDPKRLSVVAVGLLDSGDVKELEGLVKNFRG